MIFSGTCRINSLENRKGGVPRLVLVRLLDSVIPAWSAGIQADMDVSGRILQTWMPAIHAWITKSSPFSFSVGERKIMNHFVALTIHLGIRCPFTLRPAQCERTAFMVARPFETVRRCGAAGLVQASALLAFRA